MLCAVCDDRVVWVGDAVVTLVYEVFNMALLVQSCQQFHETVVQFGVRASAATSVFS